MSKKQNQHRRPVINNIGANDVVAVPLVPASVDNEAVKEQNDLLRCRGRGGIVMVSLSLATAGEDILVSVLRAVARATGSDLDPVLHGHGTVDANGLVVSWSIGIAQLGGRSVKCLNVALPSELLSDA